MLFFPFHLSNRSFLMNLTKVWVHRNLDILKNPTGSCTKTVWEANFDYTLNGWVSKREVHEEGLRAETPPCRWHLAAWIHQLPGSPSPRSTQPARASLKAGIWPPSRPVAARYLLTPTSECAPPPPPKLTAISAPCVGRVPHANPLNLLLFFRNVPTQQSGG